MMILLSVRDKYNKEKDGFKMMLIKKPWDYGQLKVNDNQRYLQNGDQPFFWMADTAWLLFHKLTLEESYIYLKNRKDKGFNIILADFIHTMGQTSADGSFALVGDDFNKPDLDGKFWSHIDRVIAMAEDLGLYMGLLPIWGSSIVGGGHMTMEEAESYSEFVTKRYGSRPNVIWITGGDIRGDVGRELFIKMAEIMKKNNPNNLVSFHPFGRTDSSMWFHQEKWLDFNIFQSGHRRYDQVSLGVWDDNTITEEYFGEDNWKYVLRDHTMNPMKPTVDGEPSYEGALQGLHDDSQPFWETPDVRRYAYWSVFAGAMGHTYGDNSIMQFYNDPSKKGAYGAKDVWQQAIHHPGSDHMKHLLELMTSIDYEKGKPADELLSLGQKEKYDRVAVFASEDYILCYDYNGNGFELNLATYKGKELEGYWFDPTTGVYSFLGNIKPEDKQSLIPHKRLNGGNDWVLVIKVN